MRATLDTISSRKTVLNESTRVERLNRLLLSVGGKDVVFQPSNDDYSVLWLLESGFVMAGRIVPRIMAAGKCHLNVLKVWQMGYSGLVGIGTGYGLSSRDGNWYRHSWGVLRDGLLETTPWGAGQSPTDKCEKRFGMLLQGKAADYLADYCLRLGAENEEARKLDAAYLSRRGIGIAG
jgi:hypothetical protein